MKKRLISLLVALCMAVTLLPVSAITAWAEESGSNLKPLQFRQGYPVITDDMPSKTDSKGHTIYTGDGWSYDGTDKVLTLAPENPTTYDLKDYGSIRKDYNSIACSTIIKKNATIVNGSFLDIKNPGSSITNHGTITSGTYSMPVINHGTITGGIFRKKPTGGNVDNGYTLNVNSQQNGSHESFYAEIKDLGSSVYVIPNSYYNTSVTILYGFFDSWPETLFPIDVTFGNTNDTHCLLKDWAPSARYHYNADHVYVTFTAPPANAGTVTLSKLTRLVIDKDGYPVGTKGGTQDYSGNGWRFEKSNKTLTLESGDYSFWEQSEVNCPVIIKDGVTTIGGMFSKKVTNYGTVEKAVINNIFENRNTVKNSYFFNSSSSIAVTNHGGTMLDCLFENAPEGIESHTITEVEDYFISAELDGIAYQAIQTKFYFTGTPKLRVNLVKDGNVKPVTSINQKLNYGGLIEDYPVGYIFTVENDNEDVVLNAAPVPGKDDPKPEPKPEPEAPTYTLTVKGGTFTYNGGEAMTSASVPVDAEVKVTLNQSAVPEGMVFDLWAMDEASLLGNPAVAYNQESFTIPAVIVWQGYRIGMELYEKYFQPTPEETAAEQPAPEAPAAAAS